MSRRIPRTFLALLAAALAFGSATGFATPPPPKPPKPPKPPLPPNASRNGALLQQRGQQIRQQHLLLLQNNAAQQHHLLAIHAATAQAHLLLQAAASSQHQLLAVQAAAAQKLLLLKQAEKFSQLHLLEQAAKPDPRPPAGLAPGALTDGPVTSIQPPSAVR